MAALKLLLVRGAEPGLRLWGPCLSGKGAGKPWASMTAQRSLAEGRETLVYILACPLGHHVLHNWEATLTALLLVSSSTACPQRLIYRARDCTASVLGDFLGMPALQTLLGSESESAFSQDSKFLSGWGSILTSCCKHRNVDHRPPLTHSTCLSQPPVCHV